MDGGDVLKGKLGLPAISQIGVVVRNMQKAVGYYSERFGIGPFTVYDSVPDKYWFRGKPSYMKLRQGKAILGGIELELIQPLEGESPFHEVLETQGEGCITWRSTRRITTGWSGSSRRRASRP